MSMEDIRDLFEVMLVDPGLLPPDYRVHGILGCINLSRNSASTANRGLHRRRSDRYAIRGIEDCFKSRSDHTECAFLDVVALMKSPIYIVKQGHIVCSIKSSVAVFSILPVAPVSHTHKISTNQDANMRFSGSQTSRVPRMVPNFKVCRMIP